MHCGVSHLTSSISLTISLRTQVRSMSRTAPSALPLRHPARVRARDAKLLRREVAAARSRRKKTIPCPCRVCNRGIRTEYSLRTVAQHVRAYDYPDWQRGSTEV
jgi:hypothetical protein